MAPRGQREAHHSHQRVAARPRQPQDEEPHADVTDGRGDLPKSGPGDDALAEHVVAHLGHGGGNADAAKVRHSGQEAGHAGAPVVHVVEVGRGLREQREERPDAAPLRHHVDPHRAGQEDALPRSPLRPGVAHEAADGLLDGEPLLRGDAGVLGGRVEDQHPPGDQPQRGQQRAPVEHGGPAQGLDHDAAQREGERGAHRAAHVGRHELAPLVGWNPLGGQEVHGWPAEARYDALHEADGEQRAVVPVRGGRDERRHQAGQRVAKAEDQLGAEAARQDAAGQLRQPVQPEEGPQHQALLPLVPVEARPLLMVLHDGHRGRVTRVGEEGDRGARAVEGAVEGAGEGRVAGVAVDAAHGRQPPAAVAGRDGGGGEALVAGPAALAPGVAHHAHDGDVDVDPDHVVDGEPEEHQQPQHPSRRHAFWGSTHAGSPPSAGRGALRSDRSGRRAGSLRVLVALAGCAGGCLPLGHLGDVGCDQTHERGAARGAGTA